MVEGWSEARRRVPGDIERELISGSRAGFGVLGGESDIHDFDIVVRRLMKLTSARSHTFLRDMEPPTLHTPTEPRTGRGRSMGKDRYFEIMRSP